MIKIPFKPCVIISTLDFDRITDRLATAIDDPNFESLQDEPQLTKFQPYYGQIRGFKFLATRIIGYKYLRLPLFLSPTIKGNIIALPYGYEISLVANIQNITFMLMLIWLGGLCSTISAILDKIMVNIQDDRYFMMVMMSFACYVGVIAYFYISAWYTNRFFQKLFANGLTGFAQMNVTNEQKSAETLQPVTTSSKEPVRSLYP